MHSQAMAWLRALRPQPLGIDWRERSRVVIGASLGILLTALFCHGLATQTGPQMGTTLPWLFGPLGASAVLLFALPNSPLAQPWSALGGHACATVAGLLAVAWVPQIELAAALAVGLAVALMLALRCLHPPGGGTALLVALTGVSDPLYLFKPVLLSVFLLVLCAMLYNRLTGRAYPHVPAPPAPAADEDLAAVLARHNHLLYIGRDELRALIEDTQLQGYQRRLADLRCGDIMSTELITVTPATPLQQAWQLFRTHRIKALPVVDGAGTLLGIVTPADFMRAAELSLELEAEGFETRWRRLRDWAQRAPAAGKPDRIDQVMTTAVSVAPVERHLAELIPLFGSTGHHHIPIVGDGRRLLGMVTQSDVVAALCRTAEASAAAR